MKKLITLIILVLTTNIYSQKITPYKTLTIKLPSNVLVEGTSTLHDWESKVEETLATLSFSSFDSIKSIEKLEVIIEATSLKSGKKLMDKLTYKALKTDKYPQISFIFKSGQLVSEDQEKVAIKLNGDLTIAGVTKNVNVLTNINKIGDNVYLKGTYELKMTDYGIDPPKALFGTIKTGNEITIKFNLKF